MNGVKHYTLSPDGYHFACPDSTLKVFVSNRRPPERNRHLDMPQGDAAMVSYLGRHQEYGWVLANRSFLAGTDSEIRLSENQLQWLESIQPQVDECLMMPRFNDEDTA